jgi:curved DNA-binding protein CbpA
VDYYQVLRVAPNASRKEIDEAYHRLLKESRYDTTIDKIQIENAYRVLSNLTAKHQYDARQTSKTRRTDRIKKARKKRKPLFLLSWLQKLTLTQLLVILGIGLAIAMYVNVSKYGYLLKDFQAGDVLYDNISDAQFGKILKVEEDHSFGAKRGPAYQIELNPKMKRHGSKQNVIWLPQNSVKARCYKK